MTGTQIQSRDTSASAWRSFSARRNLLAVSIMTVAPLGLLAATGEFALAEPADREAARPIALGTRPGVAPGAEVVTPSAQERRGDSLELSARAGFTTDYIYRGVTLSDHKPAVGAGLEATLGLLYLGTTFASVNLPSQPGGEITVSSGVRPKLWNTEFDFGGIYYLYPREFPGSPGIEYMEVGGRAETRLTDLLRVAAGFAYSPDFSNTGGWSKYAAFGVGLDLPRNVLPKVSASITSGVGYYWFGSQAVELGGFPLPAYVNWNAGITFTRSIFNLDLRYYDTNLSKENCFVFTGDPHAVPGGRINPVTNPEGLTSRWCSATFVAKFWFELN
jgi:uncharacterized protein (TIGR02001 family)